MRPIKRGIEWPYTSASRIPTRKPLRAAATARFTVTEDFPTPPFPDAIPITRVNESGWANGINFSRPLRIIFFTLSRCSCDITPNVNSTDVTPSMAETAPVISVRKRSCIGQPDIVKRIERETLPLSSLTPSTIPSSVIDR